MDKCKFCQGELEENSTVCPFCGKDNAAEEAPEAPVTEEALPEETVAAEPEETAEPVQPAEEAPAEEETSQEAPQQPAPEETTVIGKPGIQATPGKIALAAAAVAVLLAVLVALVVYGVKGNQKPEETVPATETTVAATEAPETTPATIPADGNPDDVTCKGSYTVTDEEALANRDAVVASVDGKELTNGVLQVYYWRAVQDFLSNYGAYAAYFGLDYTKPLDTQMSMEGDITWQQYFLSVGLNNWHQVQAMGLEAEQAQVGIGQEDQKYLDNMRSSLEETASQYGVTVEDLLNSNFGPGADFEDFKTYQRDYCLGVPYYYTQCDKLIPTEQELEDYFAAHEESYNQNSITRDGVLVDVRHILIMPEGGTTGEDGSTTYSEEEWKTCQQKAEDILSQWSVGDKTEESFAQLANEHSTDGGSNTNGGLYENVTVGQMVQEFNDWCFDASRKPGDTGLVKTQFGYHVMYFSASRPQWRTYAQQDWTTEQTTALLEGMTKNHPIQVFYDQIQLGLVSMN